MVNKDEYINRLWDTSIQRQRIAWPWNWVMGCSRTLKMGPFDRLQALYDFLLVCHS